jgi:hypothetical protein
MVFDALYYFQHLRFRESLDVYEILFLCLIDYFICYQMNKNDKFALYYNLPKVFTVSGKIPIFLNMLAFFRIAVHFRLQSSDKLQFLLAVIFSIFLASFTASRTIAWVLSLVVIIFAQIHWAGEEIKNKNLPANRTEDAKFDITEQESLVLKIERLKYKLISEREKLIKITKPTLVNTE